MRRVGFILFFISFCSPLSLFANTSYLTLDLWVDYSLLGLGASQELLDQFEDGIASPQVLEEKGIEIMLEEAQWLFSGMIYGFDFTYVPPDSRREIEEQFVLTPLHTIRRGDPDLDVQDIRREGSRLNIRFNYWLDDYEQRRISRSWGPGFIQAGGMGSSPMQDLSNRIDAFASAVKFAIREDLRKTLYEMPRLVEGTVFISKSPSLSFKEGEYRGFVTVIYQAEELELYPARQ